MDLLRSALALVIHKNGDVSDSDIDDLLNFYSAKKGISIDRDRYGAVVRAASDRYHQQETSLFICTDSPCLKRTFISPSDPSIETLSKELGCRVEVTGCHWQCEEAPVVTLKTGPESKSFVQCSSSESWQSIRDFISLIPQKRRIDCAEDLQTV